MQETSFVSDRLDRIRRASITYRNKGCAFTRDLKAAVDEYFARTRKPRVGGRVLWIEAAIALALYLAPVALLYAGFVTSIGWAVGLGLVMGVGYLMVGADVMHAANHGTFSSNRRVNKLFSYSMELMGMSSRNWRVQHNDLHHMHTNVVGEDGDHDLTAGEPFLRYAVFSKLKSKLIRYQHIYVWFVYSFAFVLWIFNKDFRDQAVYYREHRFRFRRGRERSRTSLLLELIAFKLAYVLLFLILPVLAGAPVLLVAIMWLTSTMLAGAIMMPVLQMAHAVPEVRQFEAGPIEVSWMEHQVRTSADIRASNRALNWLLTHLIGGLNYQKVHHVFRDVAHTHYPALSRIVEKYVARYRIESVTFPSVRSALRAHYRLMRNLGRSGEMALE